MKLPEMKVICHGIKQSAVEFDGKKFSSTTFYLPAELAETAAGKTLGAITVPYKMGDASEFEKWAHLTNSWPDGGLPVLVNFELVSGKDSQGKDTGKLQLVGIRPMGATVPAGRAAASVA